MGRMSDIHIGMVADGLLPEEENHPTPDEIKRCIDLAETTEVSLDEFATNLKKFVKNYKPVENSFNSIFKEERKANWWDKKTPKLSLREKAIAISNQRTEIANEVNTKWTPIKLKEEN